MKHFLLALLGLFLAAPALAAPPTPLCYETSPGVCVTVSAANPLPITTSGGGGGSGITSVPLGAGLTITPGTANATPLTTTSTGLYIQTFPNTYTATQAIGASNANGLAILNTTTPSNFALPSTTTTGNVFNFQNRNTGALTLTTSTASFKNIPLVSSNIVMPQYGYASCVFDGTDYNCEGVVSPLASVTSLGSNLSVTSGVLNSSGGGSGGSNVVQPSWLYSTDTAGYVVPNIFSGAGGNASPIDGGWALANTVTAGAADPVLQARFELPPSIPSGTAKLASNCLGAAGSGTFKYTISAADVASGSSPSAATLAAETQSSISLTTTGGYILTKTALTATTSATPLAANDTLVAAITFNRSGTTIGVPVDCRWRLLWE